jgi:hypothetical protein
MKKAGVNVQQVSFDEEEEDPEPEENRELLRIGRAWCHEDSPDAGLLFKNLVWTMLEEHQDAEVAEVCQQLIGELDDPGRIAELTTLALAAHSSLRGAISPESPPRALPSTVSEGKP